jgi:hypothetical protein
MIATGTRHVEPSMGAALGARPRRHAGSLRASCASDGPPGYGGDEWFRAGRAKRR